MPTEDPFMNDSMVLAAVEELPDEVGRRHLAEVDTLVAWMKLEPERYGTIDFELRRRALLARCDDDPTVVAWAAWIRSRDLAAEAEAIYAGPPGGAGAGVE